MTIQIWACYKCVDRKIGCHSTCDKYLAERKKNDEIHKKHDEERRRLDDIYNYRRRSKR